MAQITHAWRNNDREITPVSKERLNLELEMRRLIAARPAGISKSAIMSQFIRTNLLMHAGSGHTERTQRYEPARHSHLTIVDLPAA